MKPPIEAKLLLKVPMIRSTWSVKPKWAEVPRPPPATPMPWRVIDQKSRAVSLADLNDLRQKRKVAAHAVDAVHDDEFACVLRHSAEYPLQIVNVIVLEAL